MHAELHETLGVSTEDSVSAVRSAYRDLARECRPVTSTIPLHVRAIERAFEILAGARRGHLAAGRAAPRGSFAALDLLAGFEGGEPSAEEVWSEFRSNFAPAGPLKSGRITTLSLRVAVAADTPVPALAVPVFRPCPACHALGSIDAYACAHCDGSGLEEDRASLALPAIGRDERLDLDALGVLTPILRVSVIAA